MPVAILVVVTASLLVASVTPVGAGTGRRPSWAPAPSSVDGLAVLAAPVHTERGPAVALHTAGGDVTFWAGVNLGSTVPGHNPGELAQTRADYRRWLVEMGRMHVRFLRVYTLLPPSFYDELRRYNRAHGRQPVYLVQGVYLPDESYLQTGNLYDADGTAKFTEELRDVSRAVGGDFSRPTTPGRASGTWTADVSPWLAAWIIGAELDPEAVQASEQARGPVPPFRGRYFESTDDASPTEVWYAERMDELAESEAAQGRSVPIAFINWPTTDPLRHPTEPLPTEDLLQLDANHVVATAAYPAGTFASYHAYPYYPDFLRYTPEYDQTIVAGRPDPYIGYLTALEDHHGQAGLATMVTEFGVPSSIGSAHFGPLGRDQGDHTEQDAMAIDAELMSSIRDAGLAGAFVFSWTDEWFKKTWNTVPRHDATDTERYALWHDPLTNEQWFGILAHDTPRAGEKVVYESRRGVRRMSFDYDASYVYVKVVFDQPPTSPITLGFDVVGDDADDVEVVVDPSTRVARASVRRELDPIRMDGLDPADLPPEARPGWDLQRLTTNRAYSGHPAEFAEIGNLVEGTWDPTRAGYDSLATWSLDGRTLELRIPWSMLLVGDPSGKVAVTPDASGTPVNTPVETIGVTLTDGAGTAVTRDFGWRRWNTAEYTERVKAGVGALSRALEEASR